MPLADFPSQHSVIALLQRSIQQGRLGHAYLLAGNDLGELEAVGLALGQALNCVEPTEIAPDGTPLDACGQCLSCRKIAQTNHPDVLVLRPESKLRQMRIGQIVRRPNSPPRVLADMVNAKSTEGRYKVAILVAADRLNEDAANSLLKMLEEPPPQTVYVLLTTEPGRLLDTIRSRCLRLNFAGDSQREHSTDELAWLADFAAMAAEGREDVFGRYRLLGTLLERLSALNDAIEEEIDAAAPWAEHEELPPELRDQWADQSRAAVMAEYRLRRAGYLSALQAWLRDVWLRTLGVDGSLEIFPNLSEAAGRVAARLTSLEAEENLRIIESTQRTLHTNVTELLALETGLLKLKL